MKVFDYLKMRLFRYGVYCFAYLLCLLVLFLLRDKAEGCLRLFVIGIELFLIAVLVGLAACVLRHRYGLAAYWAFLFVIGMSWMVGFCTNDQTGLESVATYISDEMSIPRSKMKKLWHHGGMDSTYVFLYDGAWNGAGFEEVTSPIEKSHIFSFLSNFRKLEPRIEINQNAPLFYRDTRGSTYNIYVTKISNEWAIFYIGI